MASIRAILERLSSEGILANAPTAETGAAKTSDVVEGDEDFVVVANAAKRAALLGDGENEAKWMRVFVDLFVADAEAAAAHDDLLFFVTVDGDILVKRRVGQTLPALDRDMLICWRETLCLNLIVQMHCTLTVSVCRRDSSRRDHSSEIQMKDLKGHIHSPPSSQPYPSSIPQQPPTKSKMVALRRIAKKVYAAPYKSRMDVKDAFMNECAYPLVYYTVNDYESSDLHLHIQEKEYLCVELSVMVADQDQGGGYGHSSTASVMPLPPPVADDPTPFPVPDGFKKVVLFQGAVPYTALLDIFMQKGARPVGSGAVSSSSGTTGSGWGNLASKSLSSLNGRGSVTAPAERTEYIMMRGPRGKGVCQVAICENILADRPEVQISSPALPQSAPGASAPSSLLNMLGGTVKAGISILRSGLGAVGADDAALPGNTPGAGFRKPDALRCSMTYVNVPWHSIISDLVASHQAGNI